jgi:hypothetical protein
MTPEKPSLHKVMAPKGLFEGFGGEGSYFANADPLTSAALWVSKEGWPIGVIRPPTMRPVTPPGELDKASVLYNGFKEESVSQHIPITNLNQITAGSETEVELTGTVASSELHQNLRSVLGDNGGYTTFEVDAKFLEMNRPVAPEVSFGTVHGITTIQNQQIIAYLGKTGLGKVTFDSSASVVRDSNPPNDNYVKAMIDILAFNFLSRDKRTLAWFTTVSGEALGLLDGGDNNSSIENGLSDIAFTRKMVGEFCSKAHHIHLKVSNPNPNFYAFVLNNVMGGIGQIRAAATFSGPFKNEAFLKLSEVKQLNRLIFGTAGFQPAYLAMGTPDCNALIHHNLTQGAAVSLSRALITDDKSHGDSRIRTEETLLTAEFLMPSTHPLAEVETTQVVSFAIDMAILSHYFRVKSSLASQIPEQARPFYANPDEKRYHQNRIALALHGSQAVIIDGQGKTITYLEYIEKYVDFLVREITSLGIETSQGDIENIRIWLLKSGKRPTVYNLANYFNEDHKDYGLGCLSHLLVAELGSKVFGDDFRELSWQNMRMQLATGKYSREIQEVMSYAANLTANHYAD